MQTPIILSKKKSGFRLDSDSMFCTSSCKSKLRVWYRLFYRSLSKHLNSGFQPEFRLFFWDPFKYKYKFIYQLKLSMVRLSFHLYLSVSTLDKILIPKILTAGVRAQHTLDSCESASHVTLTLLDSCE